MRAASNARPIRVLMSFSAGVDLERREEDAGDLAIDVLTAKLPGALFARPAARDAAAPDERVLPGEWRCHHALTDRLENVRLPKVGNQQAERERSPLP